MKLDLTVGTAAPAGWLFSTSGEAHASEALHLKGIFPMAEAQGTSSGKSNRGFASMDRAKQREIARKGGESVPNEKRSFSQNRELAAAAGSKGRRGLTGLTPQTGLRHFGAVRPAHR